MKAERGSGRRVWLCACAALLAACGSGEGGDCDPIAAALVDRIEVAPSSSTVSPGQTLTLVATAYSCAGVLGSVPFTWESQNTAIATVSTAGVVSGVASGGPVQIIARAQGKQGAASVTVGSVPVASVAVTPNPTSVGVGRTAQLTARAFDAQGGELAGRVATWSSANEAIATVNASGLVTGVAAGGPATISATVDGVVGSSQVTVSLVPVATVTVGPANSSIASGGTVQLTATMRDEQGNVLSGRAVTWTSANDLVAQVSETGLVTGQRVGGPVTITATSEGRSGTAQVTVTVGAATRLAYVQQPTNVVAGAAIAPAIVVEAQDAAGNRVTTFNGLITLALEANPGNATLGGTVTTGAVDGQAPFSNIVLNRTGTGYTLIAASSGLASVTSSAFSVTPGEPDHLAFTTQPSAVVAGEPIAPAVQVEIRDALDNRTTSTAQVRVALVNPPGGTGTLGGTVVVDADNGLATFSTLTVNRAAAGYALSATSGTLTAATSEAFTVTPGAADRLVFVTTPIDVVAGEVIQPAVQVRAQDALGNPVPSFTGRVEIALQGGPVDAQLSGTTTVSAVGGVATFGTLSINRAATGYTLVASADPLTPATSATFGVAAGAASALAFVVQPTNVDENVPISPAPQVEIRDALGNRVSAYTGTVTVIVRNTNGTSAPPSGTTLGGTPSVSAVAGLATFSNLRIAVSANRQLTLRATTTSPALVAVSQIFTVFED